MQDHMSGIARDRCPRCNWLNIRRASDASPFVCTNPHCDSDFARLHPAPPSTEEEIARRTLDLARRIAYPPQGVIYYIRWADRIKIGTTMNLAQRLKGLYYDELLATEPGTYSREAARHEQFASALVEGQREWFHSTPELLDHIALTRKKYGDPASHLAGSARA